MKKKPADDNKSLKNDAACKDLNDSAGWAISHAYFHLIFFQNRLFQKILSGIGSNSLDPDQDLTVLVLGPNCLQFLSANNTRRLRVKR